MSAASFNVGDRVVCPAAAPSQPQIFGLHMTLVERIPAGHAFKLPDGSKHDAIPHVGYWVCMLDAPLKVHVYGEDSGLLSSQCRLYVCIPEWAMTSDTSVDNASTKGALQ